MRKIASFCLKSLTTIFFITGLSGYENKAFCQSNMVATNKTGLILPAGFSALIVADSLGPLRHLAVNKRGDIYVKLSALKEGKGIYYLSDTNHDGYMDKKLGFCNYPGTGILIKNNRACTD